MLSYRGAPALEGRINWVHTDLSVSYFAEAQTMVIRVFYHVCALNHWESILRDQASKLLFSGLYDETTAIHCFCVGPEAKRAATLLLDFGAKFRIEVCAPEDRSAERLTLRHMRGLIAPDDKVLYMHTKGVTKIPPSLEIYWWAFYMEYYLIKKFRQCLDLLEQSDVVGLDYYPASAPHFSGNFWWARGAYLQTLTPPCPDLDKDKYHNTETWVCGGTSPRPRLAQIMHSQNDHYTHSFPASRYV